LFIEEIRLRRRDRIKGTLPFLTGGLYFWLITLTFSKLNINFEGYKVFMVLLWVGLTILSTTKMEDMVDLFDRGNNEEDE
jgi:hypothetical protein